MKQYAKQTNYPEWKRKEHSRCKHFFQLGERAVLKEKQKA